MAKIPVRMFRLPTLTLVGQPWRAAEDDKLFWVNFSFDGLPFVLEDLAVLETGRTLRGRNFQTAPDGRTRFQFKGIPEKAMTRGSTSTTLHGRSDTSTRLTLSRWVPRTRLSIPEKAC